MAGLLDAFFNMTPEQNKGLMAAATKMLDMSAPSRVPRNIMQIAAHGMNAFDSGIQDERDRKIIEEQRAMQQQILGWKAKDAEADYGAQQGAREREARIQTRLAALTRNGMTPGMAASIVQGGMGEQQPGAQGGPGMMPSQGQQGMPDVGSQEWMQGIQQQAGMAPGGMARPGPGAGAGHMGGQPAPATGQPDWFAMGMPPQMALGMQQGKKVNRTQEMVSNMMTKAQIQFEEGDQAGLDKTLDQIQKFRPDATWKEVMENGRAVNKAFFNDGTEGDASSAEVAKGLEFRDAGDSIVGLNHFNGREESRLRKGQSPDSAAADTRFARRGLSGGAGAGAGGRDGSLDDETLDMMADQALRGDSSVFRNIGRGGQGSANLVKLRSRITQKAKAQNLTGADLAAISADYAGLATGMRVSANIGARVENAISEARELAPLAVTAGREVARSGMLPFGKAQVMFDTQTNDPALKKFAAANVGFVQAYAGAMARGQKPTVHDKEHAEKLISEATSQPAYEAVMGQLMLEMDAASKAPQNVREHLRNEIGGRGNEHGGGKGGGGSPAAKPVITLNDIAATARSSGRTTREVTAAFRAKGFKIQGDK